MHRLEFGGAELLAERFATRFGGGDRVVVACLDGEGPLADRLRSSGIAVIDLARQPGAIDLACVRRLRNLIAAEKIELVHAHQTTPFFYALLARGLFRSRPRILFTEHGRFFPDRGSRKRALLQRLLLGRNDLVVAVGESVKQAVVKYEGVPANRVHVVYNGIPIAPWNSIDFDSASVRAELGIPEDAFVVIQVARLDETKNHRMALEAFRHLAADLPSALLLLVGHGPERDRLESAAVELQLNANVKFLGSRSDISQLLSVADVAILTSLSEGIPLSLIEAMVAGLPVVATSVGGVPEVVEHGVTGLLVPTGNPSALSDELLSLANDSELRTRLGDAGRKRALKKFDEERMFAEYADLLGCAAAMSERDLLVVFSDDWGRHPSSCQHLVRELLGRYDVIWVDTIGTRPMRFDFYTLRRGIGKFAGWFKQPPSAIDDAAPKPDVWKPVMWPSFASRFSRALNQRLLARGLIKRIGSRKPVVLTTIPVVADLVGAIPARRWIYYCVDDFAVWPGLDGPTLQAMEAELVRKVDDVVAVSEPLQQRLKTLGRSSTLLTHGVELDYWKNGDENPVHFDGVERPIVIFWGLVDRRLDVDWIAALAEKLTAGTIVFVGPRQGVDPRLAALPRVKFLDAVPSKTLPSLANAASVLVMPYAALPVTRAMQPLKFNEYLATGKPVVASRLPSTIIWADAADVVDSADEFVATVVKRTKVGVDSSQLEARRLLEGESWAAKAEQLERLWRKDSP